MPQWAAAPRNRHHLPQAALTTTSLHLSGRGGPSTRADWAPDDPPLGSSNRSTSRSLRFPEVVEVQKSVFARNTPATSFWGELMNWRWVKRPCEEMPCQYAWGEENISGALIKWTRASDVVWKVNLFDALRVECFWVRRNANAVSFDSTGE